MGSSCSAPRLVVALVPMLACGGRVELATVEDQNLGGQRESTALGGASMSVTGGVAGEGGRSFGAGGASMSVTGGVAGEGGRSFGAGGTSLSVEGGAAEKGGGSFGASGASTSVEGGAAGGNAFDVSLLDGDYDVFVEAAPELPDCRRQTRDQHLTLWLSTSPRLTTFVLRDFGASDDDAIVTLEHGRLAISGALADLYGEPTTAAMQFELDEQGFTGDGKALQSYHCADGSVVTREVAATIAPDRTAPRLSLGPFLRLDESRIPAFSEFRPRFSEPVAMKGYDSVTFFWDQSEAEAAVQIVDVEHGRPVVVDWLPGIGGGEAVFQLADRDGAVGRAVAAKLLSRAYADRAGNVAVADSQTWLIAASMTVSEALELEAKPSAGLFGSSHFDSVDMKAPCEDGGCLVLESPLYNLNDFWIGQAPLALMALSLDDGVMLSDYRLRHQIWSPSDRSPVLTLLYPTGCVGTYFADRQLLEPAVDGYAWATGWRSDQLGYCAGPEREHGIVVALSEETAQRNYVAPETARLVIERLEAIRP